MLPSPIIRWRGQEKPDEISGKKMKITRNEIEKVKTEIEIEASTNRKFATPSNKCIDDTIAEFNFSLPWKNKNGTSIVVYVFSSACDTFIEDYKGIEGIENILLSRGYSVI